MIDPEAMRHAYDLGFCDAAEELMIALKDRLADAKIKHGWSLGAAAAYQHAIDLAEIMRESAHELRVEKGLPTGTEK